ncbi:MAG: glycine cleavage system protein GcvH [Chlamydiia bacterium]|nr:glycine cleavage system protein GcvH [Chlamydiia bacterium]
MKFTESHEWVEAKGGVATVGVSHHAQEELGDIVYVELPEIGKAVDATDEACVLESTKAAADVYSPVSGQIIEVNAVLADSPELVNDDAEGEGWLFKVKMSDPSELDDLMDEAEYQDLIKG